MHHKPLLLALILGSASIGSASIGCSVTDDSRGDGPILDGSCDGYCGGVAPSGCFCDTECAAQGDCCADIGEVCTVLHACDEDEGDAEGGGASVDPDDVCFLGSDRAGTTCFPTVATNPYDYPSPLNNNYRAPVRFLDVESLDLSTQLSPNFKFSEISVPHKGRYQVVQPHAVAKLQEVRDRAGALAMKSGYRSPAYNAMQPGAATRSRHMYGDAFDLLPSATSQQNLYEICNDLGAGYVAKYTSGHVHCDWRNVSVDTTFYGTPASSSENPGYFTLTEFVARVVDTDGALTVEAAGYDTQEGELTRTWTALDANGGVLAEVEAAAFVPPSDASAVIVDVGGLLEIEYPLP